MELEARYSYRLRVKPPTAALLQEVFDVNRAVWNDTLGRWVDLWREERCGFSQTEAMAELSDRRARYGWLRDVPVTPQQQTIIDLYRAISAFYDPKHPGKRPRFKRKGEHATARWTLRGFKVAGSGQGVSGDRLEVATSEGRTPLRVVWSRPLPSAPKSVTVFRDAAGHWWASFVVRIEQETIPASGRCSGLDVGLTTLATVRDETQDVPNPRFAKRDRRHVKRADRQLARKVKGSNSRAKAKRRRAEIHGAAARRRRTFFHQHARRLARAYDVIGVEALKIKNMLANHSLARAIADAGWGEFIRILEWHLRKVGRAIEHRDPRNTTQNCSECGVKAKRHVGLKDRVFMCEGCNLVMDRDRNAERNLRPGRIGPGGGDDGSKTTVPAGTLAA